MQRESPQAMLFTDSHCHLDFSEFKHQREQLIQACLTQGIHRIIVPSIAPNNWQSVLNLVNNNKKASPIKLMPCLGIHPWYLENLSDNDLEQLKELVAKNSTNIFAIGETGIDGVIAKEQDNLTKQKDFFSYQLTLANQYKLPVIVHHRRSHQDIVPMLKSAKVNRGGIVHAFSGSFQQACDYIDLGFKLGIGGTITYPRAEKTIKAIKRLPLESLVLETDAPSMPLHGYQGQDNSPLRITEVFEHLATIRSESKIELAEQIEANINAIFKL